MTRYILESTGGRPSLFNGISEKKLWWILTMSLLPWGTNCQTFHYKMIPQLPKFQGQSFFFLIRADMHSKGTLCSEHSSSLEKETIMLLAQIAQGHRVRQRIGLLSQVRLDSSHNFVTHFSVSTDKLFNRSVPPFSPL